MAESDSNHVIISRQEAIGKGLKHYFTGIPCKRGHVDYRHVKNARCMQCSNILSKRWFASNPERARAIHSKSYAKHRDRKRQQYKEYHFKNHDKSTARSRAWHHKNRDKHIAVNKDWKKNNPHANRVYCANRKARKRRNGGTHTAADIASIFKAQRGRCAYCRNTLGEKYHVDHIVPLIRGGSNDRRNLQILCEPCNLNKGSRDPIVHAQSLGRLL